MNPVKISWRLDDFSASQQDFKIFRYLNNGEQKRDYGENCLGLTLDFSPKDMLIYFSNSQRKLGGKNFSLKRCSGKW